LLLRRRHRRRRLMTNHDALTRDLTLMFIRVRHEKTQDIVSSFSYIYKLKNIIKRITPTQSKTQTRSATKKNSSIIIIEIPRYCALN